ncbi:signal peptidase I [Parabacteroides sp. AM08-6]|uniref:signal peptidase I n=1 Tax=Parabacteroides sp. AM08-6 TaxID=2292053 RepID=UPI000EFEA638|nr:signal peptidase I [Parabacteroides sp. AM08-6]
MQKEETDNGYKTGGHKGRPYMGWVITLVIAFLFVMSIRQYCTGSYQVSTGAMEEALHKGDYILVNKLPLKGNPGRNRVVLFTSPLRKDTLNSPLFLGRCIGMPGDTIEVSDEGYRVNGQLLPRSPRSLNTYLVANSGAADFLKALHKLNIPLRNKKSEAEGFFLSLTSFEEYQLREELDADTNLRFLKSPTESYTLIVPRKDRAHRLDAAALTACKEAIQREAGELADFRDGKLYLDGRETTFFFFNQDYYWILADNTDESVDSRHLGFVPRDHITGNAWFCWYSHDKQHLFKPVH